MSFRPIPTSSGLFTLALAIIGGGISFVLFKRLLQQQEPAPIFRYLIWVLLALSLTGLIFYWAIVAFRLKYHLNRNGVSIQWGLGQQCIPFKTIKDIMPGQEISPSKPFWGLNLAGLRFGRSHLADYGLLKFRTTAPLQQSLLIITNNESYVISPTQPDAFIKAWQTRRELGPTQEWTTRSQHQWPLTIPLMVDPLVWGLLALAAILGLALFGYIALQYATIPLALPVHFDILGRADRIADKFVLFTLPTAGAIVWLANAILGLLIYRRERVAAYLLWGSSIAMQLCLWVAVLTITAS